MSFLLPSHKFIEIVKKKNILKDETLFDFSTDLTDMYCITDKIYMHMDNVWKNKFNRFINIYQRKHNIDMKDKLIQLILLQYYICP